MTTALQNQPWFGRTLLGVLVLLVLTAVAVRWRLDPVAPLGADAPAVEFSAGRAAEVLATILGDEQPHPIDSAANQAVRQRITDALQGLGYHVEVQDTTSCRRNGVLTCARVRNLIAMYEGTAKGKAILLSAHYDSVAAGPGASDAGSAVAALLEIARLLKNRPAGKNSVVLLFNEGEEVALLGADAFMSQHPLAKNIALAINIEARGTSGQSVMFETGANSGWLVEALSETSKRPMTNSLLSEVYRLMPNDTDLTVYKASGLEGLNFAHGEQLPYYHTPKDNLQELNLGSLQQHGDNAYGLVQALLDADLSATPSGNHVYTDVLGLTLIHWPASWSLGIAIALLAAFAVASFWLGRRYGYSLGSAVRGFVCFAVSLAVGGATAYGVAFVLSLVNGAITPWHSSVLFNRLLLWSVVLLVVVSLSKLLSRRAHPVGFWVGVSYAWLLMGVVSSLLLPGTSYLFVLPSVVLVVLALIVSLLARKTSSPAVLMGLFSVPALVAFLVTLPTIFLVEVMIGFKGVLGTVAMGIFLGLVSTFVAPLAIPSPASKAHRYVTYSCALVVLVSAVLSVLAPAYTKERPQSLNVMYLQDSAGKAQIYAGNQFTAPPAPVLQAMGKEVALKPVLPWIDARFHSASVRSAGLPSANLTILNAEETQRGRRLTARIDAGPATQSISLLIPKSAGLKSVEMDGHVVDYTGNFSEVGEYQAFVCRGESCDGKQITLLVADKAAQPTLIVKTTGGLPDIAKEVALVRDEYAIRQHDGDQSSVVSDVIL